MIDPYAVALDAIMYAPKMTFINISESKLFKKRVRGKARNSPLFVGLRTEDPDLKKDSRISPRAAVLQFMNMRLVESSGVFFGFLFEVPQGCQITTKTDSVSIIKKRINEYLHVNLRYQDSYVNVFCAPQGAVLLTLNNSIKLFDPNIVREIRMSRGN